MDGLQAGDPQRIGPYRLLGRLGAGGMGRVFLGRSAGGRLVAVKVIRPELAGGQGFRARFEREVAAARNVSGLFTAEVVDADVFGPVPWLATAYVPGPSLDDAVSGEGPLPVPSVLALAAGLAEGLQAIHAAGLVHRDIKPSNVLLASDGPRVIDFGISRAAEASALTQTGMAVGSPGFMSPEQAEGGAVGPASDVFGLGAVLVFAATGDGPFGGGSTPALMFRAVHRQPDTSRVPAQIRPLVERCLARNPRQRPSTTDLLTELGGGRLAADWLPEPLTQVVGKYGVVGTYELTDLGEAPWRSGAAATPVRLQTVQSALPPSPVLPAGQAPQATAVDSPFAADGPGVPATQTVAQSPRSPALTAIQAHSGIFPPRRSRRGRAALLAAGLIAAAATAVVVPKALAHSGGGQPPRTTQTRSALGSSSSRTSQTAGSMHSATAPTSVPSSPGGVMTSPDPAPTASDPNSGTPTPSPSPTSMSSTPAPTSTTTAPPTPTPSTGATAPAPTASA
jgi:eukaryotic-like serine/threonine-protein kinase